MDRSMEGEERLVRVAAGPVTIEGNLTLPEGAYGIVLFAHGSGSSRHSPRNRYVAWLLNQANLATLLVDLLTSDEETIDLRTGQLRFDIELLAERLISVTDWLMQQRDTRRSESATSAPAPAPGQRWWLRPSVPIWWARWSLGRAPRSGRTSAAARPGADLAHRRWKRLPGYRVEPGGARATPLRKAARHRSRGDSPLRRTRRAGRSRAVGARMVRTPPPHSKPRACVQLIPERATHVLMRSASYRKFTGYREQ